MPGSHRTQASRNVVGSYLVNARWHSSAGHRQLRLDLGVVLTAESVEVAAQFGRGRRRRQSRRDWPMVSKDEK